jgi:hypothetical protein
MPIDTSAITDGLVDPASASGDGQSVSARPITDMIAGIQFNANAIAVCSPRRGLRFSRLYPQGPVRSRGGPCQNGIGWPNWC